MYTNVQLVAFVLNALSMGARYWYGTFGQKATTSLYNGKKGQYPSHYTSARAAQYKADIAAGKMVTDCMGLIKWFFWSKAGTRDTKYADGFPDISANTCITSYCEQTGKIGTLPEIPGLVLWCSGHIGLYIGNGYAVEARGFAYGVVKTKVQDRSWTKWGKLKSKYLTYVNGAAPVTGEPDGAQYGTITLKKGSQGEAVKELQTLLISMGFSCGKWGADGDFGSGTEKAVIAFQYHHGLPETGVVGADDFAKLAALANPEEDEPEPDDPTIQDDAPDADQGDDPGHGCVTVTSGNTVNVRAQPNGSAAIMGVAYLGESFPYTGADSGDWREIEFGSGTGWINAKYTTVADAPAAVPAPPSPAPDNGKGVIVDISQHNNLKHTKNDWAKIARSVDLLILRCGVTRTDTKPLGIGIDDEFAYAAKKCREHGIPFGVYFYSKFPKSVKGNAAKVAEAKKEAKKCWDTASPYSPLFYCIDVEEGMLTNASITAFADELRRLGAKKVGMYIGHNYYPAYEDAVSAFDFPWIPRYGKNDGKFDPKYTPAYPCAIHQYSSKGDGHKLGFYDDTVDVNRLTGSQPLSWFLEK